MFGSPSATTGLNLAFTTAAATFDQRKEESDLRREQEMNYGLLRFSSVPSSLLGEVCGDLMPARPSSFEAESLLARFIAPNTRDEIRNKAAEQSSGFSSISSQMLYHSQQQQQQQQQAMEENTYRAVSSMAMEANQMKRGGANLIRQSSSPAGFLAHLNVDSGYDLMRGMSASNKNGIGAEFKGHVSFSSRQNSLSRISEMGSEGISAGGGGGESSEENGNGHCFIPCYSGSSWEESLLSDNFSARAKKRAGDVVGLNQTEIQNGAGLTHQFSLPKTSAEMAMIEKFLHFQDSVPCRIRAKRGCATHPRSIAERVRRTRISERMRKLQELVPNMDKQTNTADMLDLAVDYIKDLQNRVKGKLHLLPRQAEALSKPVRLKCLLYIILQKISTELKWQLKYWREGGERYSCYC